MKKIEQALSPALHATIAGDYASIRAAGHDALKQGKPRPEPIPKIGEPRWGVSAVLRPSAAMAQRCNALNASLEPCAGRDHAWYDHVTLHSTVRSIENFRGRVMPDDPALHLYRRCLEQAVSGLSEISVRYNGAMLSASGILLVGWPCDDTLQTVRARFQHALAPHLTDAHHPEQNRLRHTAHISTAVFTDSVFADANALAARMEKQADTFFGTETYRHIDLVAYALTPGSIAVDWLDRIPLG